LVEAALSWAHAVWGTVPAEVATVAVALATGIAPLAKAAATQVTVAVPMEIDSVMAS
jgi:hypothetical protein